VGGAVQPGFSEARGDADRDCPQPTIRRRHAAVPERLLEYGRWGDAALR
jgi:hypothetical protein